MRAWRRKGPILLTILLASSALGGAAFAEGDASVAIAAAAAQQVGEVVVTARKRKENLEDVPIAITAVSGGQLNEGQHLRIEDLNQFAPSTNIVIPSPHQTSFAIRGIGANPGNDGLEQSAGLFLDGVYLGRPGMATMDLIDIDQMELLRGPQGTLFGKNTTAGALNITTAAPSFTPSALAQVSYGNYNYTQLQGMVTGPIWGDVLAGRLTVYKTLRDGVVNDVTNGQKLDNIDREGARGQLLFQPDANFRLRLIGEWGYEGDTNGATVLNNYGATPAAFQKDIAAAGATVVVDPHGLTAADNDPTRIRVRQEAVSAQADWDIGRYSLTSITAYRNWFYSSFSDVDGSNKSVLDAGYSLHDDQFSQELRIASPKDQAIEWVAGAYYFQQDVKVDQITQYGADAAAWLSDIPNSLLPVYAKYSSALATLLNYNNSRWDIWATPSTRSYALFGQATWHLTSNWNLTGGFRETYETKYESVWRPNPVSTLTGAAVSGLAFETYGAHQVGVSDWAPSGLISTDYSFRPGLMAYASASRGEKAGGVNATVPSTLGTDSLKVKPEIATSFEIGLKSQWFEHRLQVNADLFDSHIQDYQATYITTPPGGGSSLQLLTNVGMVRTRGAELEVAAAPIEGLTLNGNVSYNDAIYLSYPTGPCPAEDVGQASCNLSGRPVAGAPRWIVNLNGEYHRDLANDLQGFIGGEYSWRSTYYGYLDDSIYTKTGDFGLLNAHLGLRLHGGKWEASLWAKNLTNVRYVASDLNDGSLLPGVYVPFYGDPRTYGFTVRAAF